jgi:hypothetical protein
MILSWFTCLSRNHVAILADDRFKIAPRSLKSREIVDVFYKNCVLEEVLCLIFRGWGDGCTWERERLPRRASSS